jgi:hypothetical protein
MDSEISLHEVLIYRALCQNRDRWLSDRELAQQIGDITPRIIRAHVLKLVRLRLVDQPRFFPADRYRLSAKASPDSEAYVRQLEHAASVLGVPAQGVTARL